ncbi:MAG: hypothetical protein AAB922_05205, partial [Patescibacteria group bacterium]
MAEVATIAPEVRAETMAGGNAARLQDPGRRAEAQALKGRVETGRDLQSAIRSSEANREMRRGRGEAATKRNVTGAEFDDKGNLT